MSSLDRSGIMNNDECTQTDELWKDECLQGCGPVNDECVIVAHWFYEYIYFIE